MKVKELQAIVTQQGLDLLALRQQVEQMGKVIVSLQTQQTQVVEVVPCSCEQYATCTECFERLVALRNGSAEQAPAPAPKGKGKQAPKAKASDNRPSSDDDFKTVVIPFLATRVKHNIANNVDCDTDAMAGYGSSAWAKDVTDFRFHLAKDERRLYNAAKKKQNVSAQNALIMLAGACERAGVKA